MKNQEHSRLVKRLNTLKKQYNWYYVGITLSKENITMYNLDPYSERSLSSLIGELEDEKYMVKEIQKEIIQVKKQIYFSQKEYSVNHANQQPSQPLTKLEGSETNS